MKWLLLLTILSGYSGSSTVAANFDSKDVLRRHSWLLGTRLLRGSQSLTLGIDVTKPSLNMGEKMRLLAVRATQRCDVARQVRKALRVQLHTSIDHIAGARTYKLQNAHRYILTLLALIRRDEKPRAASHPRGQSAVRT